MRNNAITSLLLLLFRLKVCLGQDPLVHPPAINFTVVLTSASEEAIAFDTGIGVEGRDNRLQIKVYDHCKTKEAASERNLLGTWYPVDQATDIMGLQVDTSQLNAPHGTGPGNVMPWSFVEGIEDNTDIFQRYNATYAELFFCVSVELLVDNEVASWDELDVFVPMNTAKSISLLRCVKNTITLSMTLKFDSSATAPEEMEDTITAAVSQFPMDDSCSTKGVEVEASFGSGRRLQATETEVGVVMTTIEPEGDIVIDFETESDQFMAALDTDMKNDMGSSAEAVSLDSYSVEVEQLGSGLSISAEQEVFFEHYEFNFTLPDGALAAYFCDPVTHEIFVAAENEKVNQGSVISVCFNVADDEQFEVDDIEELHIGDTSGSDLTAAIIVEGETVVSGYGRKFCSWTTQTMRTCVADFLLSAAFFDFSAVTLTGYGAISLRLGAGQGGSQGRQRRVLFEIGSRELQEGQTGVAGFEVESKDFQLQGQQQSKIPPSSSAVGVARPGRWSHIILSVGLVSFMGCFV